MEQIALGQTGLTVSQIGLGLAALGRPGYINLGHRADVADGAVAAMQQRTAHMLDLAYAAGIRYFDAARSYGKAEAFLAAWLGRDPVPDVVIGSKWGYTYTAGWESDAAVHEVKDHGAAAFDRQLEETRELLGDHVDLYQVHSATLDTGVLDDRPLHRRMASLCDDGVAIGLSTSGPNQAATIRRALEVEVDGVPLFSTVQATWNLLETSAGPALEEATAAGVGIIVKEALANGRLTRRNPALPAPLAEHPAPDALAIAAALAQPWSSVVLSGAATPAQLESNIGALHVAPDVLAAVPDLAEEPGDYWTTRAALAWN